MADDLNINIKVTSDQNDQSAERRLDQIDAKFNEVAKSAAGAAEQMNKVTQTNQATAKEEIDLTKELREAREKYGTAVDSNAKSVKDAISINAQFNAQLEREIDLRKQLAETTEKASNSPRYATNAPSAFGDLRQQYLNQTSEMDYGNVGPQPLPYKGADPRQLFIGGFAFRSAAGLAGIAAGDRQAPAAQALTAVSDIVLLASGAQQLKGIAGTVGNTITTFGGQVIGSLGQLSPALGGVAAAVGPMATAFIALAPIVLAVGAAVAAYTLLMKQQEEQYKKQAEGLNNLIAGQAKYHEFIQTATTEQAKKKIEALETENKVQEGIKSDNMRIREEAVKNLTDLVKGDYAVGGAEGYRRKLGYQLKYGEDAAQAAAGGDYSQIVNMMLKNEEGKEGSPLKAAKDAYDAANKQIEQNGQYIGRLTGDLQSNALAANDAAEAMKKLNAQSIELAESQSRTADEMAKMARTATPEQVRETIAAEQQRLVSMKALEKSLRELGTEEAIKKADALTGQIAIQQDRVDKLTGAYDLQGRSLIQIAEARKAEDEAAKAMNKTLEEGVKAWQKSGEIQSEINARTERQAQENKDIADKRKAEDLREQQDYQNRRVKEVRDFGTKIAEEDARNALTRAQKLRDIEQIVPDAVEKVERSRTEKLIAYQLEEARRAEDHLEKLAQIEKEGRTKSLEAAAKLDAWGVLNATRATADKMDKENANYLKESRRKEQDWQRETATEIERAKVEADQRKAKALQQLADDDAQQKLRRDQEIAAFNVRLSDEETARKVERQRRLEDYATQDRLREAAFNESLRHLRSQLEDEGSKIRTATDSVFPYVTGKVEGFFDGLKKSAEGLGLNLPTIQLPTVQQASDVLNQAAGSTISNGIGDALSGLGGGISDVWNGITSGGGSLLNDVVNSVSSWGNSLFGGSNPLNDLFGGFFADGGYPPVGKIVKVGERGPEWAAFQDPVRIYSADSGFGAGGVSIGTLSIPIDLRGQENVDAQKVAELVPPAVRKVIVEWGQGLTNGN